VTTNIFVTDINSDYEYENISPPPDKGSPKPQDLVQYEAYLSRELPRSVRKELEMAMESLIGPIEETLKNQLENIVRNCQERLSRNYQPTVQSSSQRHLEQTTAITLGETSTANFSNPTASSMAATIPDSLAQYAIPADSSLDLWSGLEDVSHKNQATSSESAYYSDLHDSSTVFARATSDLSILPLGNESFEYAGMMSDLQTEQTPSFEVPLLHSGTRKGKEKATYNQSDTQWRHIYSHQQH
jgi:hypothetical protein